MPPGNGRSSSSRGGEPKANRPWDRHGTSTGWSSGPNHNANSRKRFKLPGAELRADGNTGSGSATATTRTSHTPPCAPRAGGLDDYCDRIRTEEQSDEAASVAMLQGTRGHVGTPPPDVPFVSVDGVPFYSDRFYVASSEYDHLCGAHGASPMTADTDDCDLHAQSGAKVKVSQKEDDTRTDGSNSATNCSASSYDENHALSGDFRNTLSRHQIRQRDFDQRSHCDSNPNDSDHPLINVSRLVDTLSLRAAIFGTYSLDTKWFLESFRSLWIRSVPTLVLHGQKGEGKTRQGPSGGAGAGAGVNGDGGMDNGPGADSRSSATTHTSSNDVKRIGGDEQGASDTDSKASEELYTQTEETLAYARVSLRGGSMNGRDGTDADTSDAFLQPGADAENIRTNIDNCLAMSLHFTRVATKWVPPVGGVGKHAGEFKRGVHHPKFLLLFETSGSIVVVVTTANLTPRRTMDGVWVQRFHPLSSSLKGKTSTSNAGEGSVDPSGLSRDFGQVLRSLLSAQTHAIQAQAQDLRRRRRKCKGSAILMTPHAFCRRYLGWDDLGPISSAYDYEPAQVHLVATVPGIHSTPEYGRQRVQHILERLSTSSATATDTNVVRRHCAPWLPPMLMTQHDRLIIQSTSMGEWDRPSLTQVMQSYMAGDGGDLKRPMQDDEDQFERLDIVWPSERFMQSVLSNLNSLRQDRMATLHDTRSRPSSPLKRKFHYDLTCHRVKQREASFSSHKDIQTSPRSQSSSKQAQIFSLVSPKPPVSIPWEKRINGGYFFLSTETFNKMDASCISRMMQWEANNPIPLSQRPTLVSHLKTIARVVGPPSGQSSDSTAGKLHRPLTWYASRGADAVFSWILMTSACLSRGAQGQSLDQDRASCKAAKESVSYANFELGVLFCSRLQHKPTDRIYCWKESAHCRDQNGLFGRDSRSGTPHRLQLKVKTESKQSHLGGPRLIFLPIPYRYDATRYQLDDCDDLAFVETPYFNEITDCSAGNVRITPFGDYIARKQGD